jgi:hypothetical protein
MYSELKALGPVISTFSGKEDKTHKKQILKRLEVAFFEKIKREATGGS